MAQESDVFIKKIEQTARSWNAVVDGAFPDVQQFLARVREGVERIEQFVRSRPRVRVDTLLARAQKDLAGSPPENREQVAQSLGGLVEHLESWFDDFNIELQTLQAQARRTLDAGNRLNNALRPFLESAPEEKASARVPVTAGSDPAPLKAEIDALKKCNEELRQQLSQAEARAAAALQLPPVPTVREKELEEQAQQLEARIAVLRGDLADALVRARTLPPDVQEELATLRMEVASLRETNERLSLPLPGTSRERFEVIASQAFDQEGKRKQLGQILVDAGVVKPEQVEIALYEQQSSWRRHLGAILVDLGFASEENIAHALAAQLALPFADLRREHPSEAALGLVTRQLALHHTCIPLRVTADAVTIAMANPLDLVAIDDLRLAVGRNVLPLVATAGQIRQAIREQYLL